MASDKNWPSHLLGEILPQKKLRYSYVPSYVHDFLTWIMTWISTTNLSSFLIRRITMRLLSYRTFVITIKLNRSLFESSTQSIWHPTTVKTSCWIFWGECQHFSTPFPNFLKSELRHAAAFFIDNAQMTRVCCTVDKT